MSHRPLGALGTVFAVALALCTAAASADRLDEVGRVVWRGDAPGFGGFSGLEVSADGMRIAAVSDRGGLARATLRRRDGTLAGIDRGTLAPLLRHDGTALRPGQGDAEGLTGDVDGMLFVSFEGDHRIARLDPGGTRLRRLDRHRAFADLQRNSGLEALATDPQGRLVTLPERSGALDRPFPVYRRDTDGWSHAYDLRRDPPFLPVGADMGPDGRLYLLERHFTGLAFVTRIRSFAFGGDGLADERVLLTSAGGSYDNLEGLAAWRDPAGAIRLLAISDDNFHFLQRTEFVEFRLASPQRAENRP